MAITANFRNHTSPPTGRRRLRSMMMFPTLLTLGNLLCGFAGIYFAMRAMHALGAGTPDDAALTFHRDSWERLLPSYLTIGAGLVLVGMVFDCFDGLVARARFRAYT